MEKMVDRGTRGKGRTQAQLLGSEFGVTFCCVWGTTQAALAVLTLCIAPTVTKGDKFSIILWLHLPRSAASLW